jgi:hypothetical protein
MVCADDGDDGILGGSIEHTHTFDGAGHHQ